MSVRPPLRRLAAAATATAMAIGSFAAVPATDSDPTVAPSPDVAVPGSELTYTYPLDSGPVGPGPGDSGQPRGDLHRGQYGDAGNDLTNGVVSTFWLEDDVVGFNEDVAFDTGQPQPRIEFALGTARDLTRVRIDYLTGWLAVVGPASVEISTSTDGGATYGPATAFTGFDRTDDGTMHFVDVEIPLLASDVTHVRMDFFQGMWSKRANTSAWLFLSEITFFEAANVAPDCTFATPSVSSIWPANHRMVPVEVDGVTDPDGDAVTLTVDSILQDEAVDARGSGSTDVDGDGIGTDTALVRAERAASKRDGGNGRVYHVGFTADDGNGGSCSGVVTVGVPKNSKDVAVDDGALFDSTAP